MKRWVTILMLVVVAVLCLVPLAFAYDEPGNMAEDHTGSGGVLRDCVPCHRLDETEFQCAMCHVPHLGTKLSPLAGKGPHGLYATTTDRCDACHDTHSAAGNKLLMASTVTGSCYTCHDGTGGKGVFGTIAARGVAVGARHRIDTTSTVPGGDPDTGGPATMAFRGEGGNLGCNDCHSPHDANTVAAYQQERMRGSYTVLFMYDTRTNKLLKRNPGGSTATATVYGSDWCLACHKGRASMGSANNHPVESSAATDNAFYYDYVALMASDDPTSLVTTGTLGRTNRGYMMTSPRDAKQQGHNPICQQCHEDSRFVGTLSPDGLVADVATYSVTTSDGAATTDNPRFQNFPHETVNTRMTVESWDDLCTNCHAPEGLP